MPPGAIPFPFGICRICKDKATGVHYGVATCEGCKGFFKRSTTRGDQYKCFFGGDCDLTPKNRNRCKSCRFKKCLDVGMSVEAVRMGRIPKVDKEKALQVFQRGGSNFHNLEIEVAMTGSGTYDFKINPKEETQNTIQQTGTEDRAQGRTFHQEPVLDQSGNSQSVHGNIEFDSEKHLGIFDPQIEGRSAFQDDVSMQMSDMDRSRQFVMERFPRAISGFHPYTKFHKNSNHMNSCTVRSSSGERSSIRSETISSHEVLSSGENKFSNIQMDHDSVSKYYSTRQSSCDNLKETFATYDIGKSKNASAKNLQRWHSFESQLNCPSVQTWHTPSHGIHSSYQTHDFDSDCVNITQSVQQRLIPETSRVVDANVQHRCNFPSKQASGLNPSMHPYHQEQNQQLPPFQPDFREEFQQFVEKEEKESQFCERSSTRCMPTLHKDHGHTFESDYENCTEKRGNFIDTDAEHAEINCEAVYEGKLMQRKENSSSKNCFNLGNENCMLKQVFFPENNKSDIQEHEGQTGASILSQNLSPTYTQSFENLKFSTPGSVISNEGSNSSQRSGYSPAVIQLLLDQVIECDEGQKLTEKLKEKFRQTNTDQEVVKHVLNLVSKATEKAKKMNDGNCESKLKLDRLPENKLESMDRFLNDMRNNFHSIESPLIKKKRIAEMQLFESFESLDVEKCAKPHTGVQGNKSHMDEIDRYHFVPQSQQVSSDPSNQMCCREIGNQSQQVSSNPSIQMCCREIGNGNHSLNVTKKSEISSPIVQLPPQGISRNPIDQVPPRDFSLNQNSHFHPHHHSYFLSENSRAQVVASHNAREKSEVVSTQFFNDAHDNTVTSTNTAEENPETVKEILKTIDCTNLGMKILNRLKPEHREKIRLYKQGQIHLRIMTDSDEDCSAIYEKLMQGIPGLNDRVLGFCDSVPGFIDLPKEDKEKLIKRSYYDMWTLSYAEYFQNGGSFWILPTGEIYSAQAMRKILNDEMVDTIMKFAGEFNILNLTDLETALLAAIRLTETAGLDIQDKAKVKSLNSHLLNTLMFEMKRNHPSNHARLLVDVFHLVPLIEDISRIQSQIIANFSINRFKKKTAGDDVVQN